jgi:uncharacterized protein with HEPN domain
MKDAKLYLLHISECIARIESYTAGGLEEFISSTLIQDAVVRNLQTLGESVKRLSEDVRALRPDIQWTQIAGFRNVLVHDYLGLDNGIIWDVIKDDLPVLKTAVEDILASLDNQT